MLTNLDWLPKPADDFSDRLKLLRRSVTDSVPADFNEQIIALATAALDDSQLGKLARLAAQVLESGRKVDGLTRVKLGLLGDGTLSLLTPVIVGSALRHGLLLDVVEAGYNSAVQEAVDPDSPMRTAGLDMALIAGDARLMGLDQAAATPQDAADKVDAAFNRVKLVVDSLRPSVSSAILVQTIAPLAEPLFGSFDRVEPGSPFALVETLNRRLADWAATGEIVLVDIARLAATVGLEHWNEPRHWLASKLSFAPQMLPVYAEVVARCIAAVRGRSRKCLVLDLDNTLWGGVIGDDGVAGIALGQGSAAGEAFLAVQQMALELRARGIVLAVCSKNEDDAARLPFREHPDMLLREDHIAVFQANWVDKASNLKVIAEQLNIGVDALVFLDDNPAERMQVRQALPLVAVPELPEDPAFYPRMLAAAGYFEAVAISKEDRERAGYYQANAQRAAALASTGDLNSYLASLEMDCVIAEVDPMSRARVSQLINKSNQYNLTTRRYSESEVAAAEAAPDRHAIQVRLLDRFGDNGIISVIIADKMRERWELDTWLMSCRVLGRRVQEAVLAHLAEAAKREGARELIGRYIPSPKNRMVADHYPKLGFSLIEQSDDGATTWGLQLSDYTPPELPMRVQDRSLAVPEPAE